MADKTRQKILEVTEKLIQMKGLARVTTKEIAHATGLSEGALYRHFEHKEEVFFALIVQRLPTFLDSFKAHMPGEGSVIENLEVIALAAINYFRQLIPLSASFFAATDLLIQYRQKLHQISGRPEDFFEVVAAYIAEEQNLGRIANATPALNIAILLLGPCFQYEFFHQLTDMQPFGQTEHEFVRNLVQGLAPGHFPHQ